MTRATLLYVLDHATTLGPAEVRELEQLAQAFPYCQTAHLLLAKAAHDQGTMLAGQRLRRAATYAADRALLRRLIEQVAPPVPAAPTIVPAPVAAIAAVEAELPAPAAPLTTAPEEVAATAAPEAASVMSPPAAVAVSEDAPPEPHPATAPPTKEVSADLPPASPETAEAPGAEEVLPVEEAEEVLPIEEADGVLLPAPEEHPRPATEAAPVPEAMAEPAAVPAEAEAEPDAAPAEPQAEAEPDTAPEEAEAVPATEEAPPEPAAASEATDDLPAQAPAIRPPVEAGEAQFEFGLAVASPLAAPLYELPGLVDEWAASAVTRSLGDPTLLTELLGPAAGVVLAPTARTPAAFTGDDAVGYALGESSRLGFCLHRFNLLAADYSETPASESVQPTVAHPPVTPLPPADAFFEPDPLLLHYWATYCPPPPPLPSSLDLINNFLRRQPRLTRPVLLPSAASSQADLSVRSTRTEPELATESLARILVRQGKTARAIEVYERLMVKQPEKMAYFAAQIQQLHRPA